MQTTWMTRKLLQTVGMFSAGFAFMAVPLVLSASPIIGWETQDIDTTARIGQNSYRTLDVHYSGFAAVHDANGGVFFREAGSSEWQMIYGSLDGNRLHRNSLAVSGPERIVVTRHGDTDGSGGGSSSRRLLNH